MMAGFELGMLRVDMNWSSFVVAVCFVLQLHSANKVH